MYSRNRHHRYILKIIYNILLRIWMICLHDLIWDIFYRNFIANSSLIPCLNTQRRLQTFASYTSFISHVMAFIQLYWCKEFILCDEAAATKRRMTKDKDNELCMFHPNSIFFIKFSVKVEMIYVFVIKLRVSSYK